MDMEEKLRILADSAKYDAACTSSGVDRAGGHSDGIGNAAACSRHRRKVGSEDNHSQTSGKA